MAACQTPLIAATKKAFLSFVNISFLLRFCINWCFSSREYSGRGVGGRGSLFPFCLFSMTFQAAFLEAVYAGRGRMNEEKKKERERETHVCCVPPRPPVLPCHLYLHEWKTPERHFKPCQQGFMF